MSGMVYGAEARALALISGESEWWKFDAYPEPDPDPPVPIIRCTNCGLIHALAYIRDNDACTECGESLRRRWERLYPRPAIPGVTE